MQYPGDELEIFDKATIWRNISILKQKNILKINF